MGEVGSGIHYSLKFSLLFISLKNWVIHCISIQSSKQEYSLFLGTHYSLFIIFWLIIHDSS